MRPAALRPKGSSLRARSPGVAASRARHSGCTPEKEALAARIADDIVAAIDPKHVEVELKQSVRGGIEIVATAARPA